MFKHYAKKDADITRDCFACNVSVPKKTLTEIALEQLAKFYPDITVCNIALLPVHDEVYMQVTPRSWAKAANAFANMATTVDDGKRYNVWCVAANRWTNYQGRDTKNPEPLTHAEAEDLLLTINGKEAEFIIKQVGGNSTIKPVAKSSGMNCAGKYCNEFNPHAEPNQSNGTYKCYSCRGR